MCGIVGVINREKFKVDREDLVKFFNQALYCDAVRGRHGTGVIGVNQKGDVSVFKRALAAPDFMELSQARKIIDDQDNIFMVGHNRWATKGSHTTDNTHPFSHNHIHLVHNGTLTYYAGLNKGSTKKFDVDSDALAHYISESTSVKAALENIEGAYSLVWYDDIHETLNFARNEERPMYLGRVKGSNSLVFGSEGDMIKWICSRNKIVLDEVFELGTGKLMSVPLDPAKKMVVTKFVPKKVTYYYQNSGVGYKSSDYTNGSSYIAKKNPLEDHIIQIKVGDWLPYNPSSVGTRFGSLKGKFADMDINVNGISEEQGKSLANKTLKVVITVVSSNNSASARFVEIVNNIVEIGPKIEEKDKEFKEKTGLTKWFYGPNKRLLSLEDYKKKVKNGCTNCDEAINPDDHETIYWDWAEKPYCADCGSIFGDEFGFTNSLTGIV